MTFMEAKLVLALTGYQEMFDFTSCDYHDMNMKQQTWREISELSWKLFWVVLPSNN